MLRQLFAFTALRVSRMTWSLTSSPTIASYRACALAAVETVLAARQIVGKVSPWIEPDALSAPLRRDSEAALRQVQRSHDAWGVRDIYSTRAQGSTLDDGIAAVHSLAMRTVSCKYWLCG